MIKSRKKFSKYNVLFISTNLNYFIENNPSSQRMYKILNYFHRHKDFNVIVLQPKKDKKCEIKLLKNDIKAYYYRASFFNNNLFPLSDFNFFFIMKVRQIINRYNVDLIHVDFFYGINSLRFFKQIPVSYNAHNVESIYAKEVGKYYHKIPSILRYFYPIYISFLEKKAVMYAKNICAISEFDKNQFSRIYNLSKEKIFINPIGYSELVYNKKKEKDKARECLGIEQDKFIVIFHGNYFLSYANEESIKFIKDKLAPKMDDDKNILFLIAGKMPPFTNKKNIKFLGYIDNLLDFIYSADIAIAPIFRGSGVKTKILDYLSGNIPIITTKRGIEGLRFKDGVHGFIVEKSVTKIIRKIKDLKSDPEKILEMKKNIDILINEHYDWNKILKNLSQRYIEVIKKPNN